MRAPANHNHPLLVWAWGLIRLDFVGVAFGALFFCLSLTPSLVPRDWLYQGLIGGINASIGYAIGVVVGKVLYYIVLRGRTWWPPEKRTLYWLKGGIVVLSGAGSLLMLIPAAKWQRHVSALMGMPGPETPAYLRTVLASLVVGGTCVAVARVVLDAIKLLARTFIRRWHVHQEVALAVGTAIVVIVLVTLINGVLYRGFLAGANRVFQPQDFDTRPGVSQPVQPERSGSANSSAPWDTLGYQGRNFVATGPHADELTRVNGKPAKEPIRVYAGLQTADDDAGRMDVILRELDRTDAFSREVLVIVPTTGTGWVNPVAARAIETMYNGDTALVAVQYSYLPSWISFLGDREKSMNSGRLLVDTVHGRWVQLPENARPKLLLYGESLGSMAGQGAFPWLPDIARMDFSAVLWVGPPHESPLWSGLVQRRDPGTPEVQPRYDNGRTVRFSVAGDTDDIVRVAEPRWDGTRVLFLQHSSDPIVWWSPDLLFSQPDWLIEPAGPDRSTAMRWYPIITFWQVGADIMNASSVPGGHGHNYGNSVLDGWVAVAPPEGWTPSDTERVRAALKDASGADGPET
ncbi:alpha/beta hydrolase [Mycolicibacterium arenosum]|uniref:Alpha/beta hydrolase n=1 Tax=Mycolicibacterium arenosum TaxID=2952157 RepID=A0ABT1LX28_9MYCO|nr:alpha/beta-hydrolase family protein [Mycolicibacterium sp. CAU 1645]MCP9271443.1 alpha/beta hydrolase [Mycolicibacterium sp. CAU 1645]